MKYKHGQHIELVWDGQPDEFAIMGHVSTEQGLGILEEDGSVYNDTIIGQGVHKYARWSCQGDRPDGCSQILRTYGTPGQGRFKVTTFGIGLFATKPLITKGD